MKNLFRQLRPGLSQLSAAVVIVLLFNTTAMAVGTSAGININNTATATFSRSGTSFSVNSNTASFQVDEKLDVNLVWQDTANIAVNTPDANRVLSFLLTNTGNGSDSYDLNVNNLIAGDQFDPVLVNVYLDANGNGIYDPGIDTLYDGSNDPILNADQAIAVFVVNNIPAALNPGDLGNSRLTATSNTGSGVPGTAYANAGDGGSNAVVGTSGGTTNVTGIYEVSNVSVSINKSVVISDPLGGNQPMPGATMTYTLQITVTGTGTANNIVITDPIPADTTYSPGTLTLNSVSITDADDGDAGDVGVRIPNTVAVDLGSMTPASAVQTITFNVIIN
jgi:uncharacterized repeat protein (TIGR01451 family)